LDELVQDPANLRVHPEQNKIDGFELECLGFSDDELAKLLADDGEGQSVPRDREPSEPELCLCPKCGHTFPK
jgi:hypothetical protein